MHLVLKMVRSLLFPDKLIHRPVPGKGFVFNTGKPLRVLNDTGDLTGRHHHRGAVDRDGNVISHWTRTVPMNNFKNYTQIYLKCKLNGNPVHRTESLVEKFIMATYVPKQTTTFRTQLQTVCVWCSDTRHVMQQEIYVSNGKVILHSYAGKLSSSVTQQSQHCWIQMNTKAAEWTRNLQTE